MHAAYVRPGGVALVSFSFDYVKVSITLAGFKCGLCNLG